MYNTSTTFKNAIMADVRELKVKLTLSTATNTWELEAKDIELGSLNVSSACMSKEFELGAVVASTCSVALNNRDGAWNNVILNGALLTPYCGVVLPDTTIEYVPMGQFIVDQPGRPYASVALQATDRLILLDEPLANVNVTYPITNRNLLQAIGNHCNVPIASSALSMLNNGHAIQKAPANDRMTCRDAVSEIALMAGGWARMSRLGALEIVQLQHPNAATAFDMRLGSRKTWQQTEDEITITGMSYGDLQWGATDYNIEIAQLELLADGDAETILAPVWQVINGFTYVPYNATYYGNPAFDPGDAVLHSLRDEAQVLSIITKHQYKLGGDCQMIAEGKSSAARKYVSANTRRLASVAARIEERTDDKLTNYQQASAQMSDMLGLMMGVYPSSEELEDGSKILYWHNKPTREESDIIWKFNGLVLAVSNDGGQTWAGQTADATVIARIVYTLQLFAHQIILADGSTAQEAFDAAVTVFRDIPQPPYKQGDLWHMPELTVDYWYNSGLTVDQVMALGFTVDERMGGNSYVCINGRASGSFNRADWELTGTTDKTSANLSERITTNETQITNMGMTVSEVTEVVDGHGTSLGTAHSKISNLEAAQLTMIDQINAVGDVFTDIPQPPYKVGDVWHMPELTVDYWYNSGLTVDQIIALGFTVKDRMGGNSYVCVNGRASGSFKRSDWMATGTTDTASVIHESAYGAIEARLTQKIDGVETAVTEVRAGYVRIAQIDGTLGETIIDGDVINTGSVTGNKIKAGEITGNHLAVDSITANKIKAGEIITEKLAIGAVNEDRLANNAVSEDKIKANAVTADKIKALAISSTHLAANSVIAGKIATNAVTATTIAAGAVTAGKIAANSITATELSTIAGFTFSDSTMSSGSGTSRVYISGNPSFSSYAIIIGGDSASTAPFRVSRAGALVASNATITGTVTSANFTSSFGQIGPLKISSQGLTYTSSGRFQINASGYLVASGVELSGKLSGCYKTGSGGIWIDQKNHPTRIKDNSGNWRVFGLQTFWAASDSGGGTTYPVTALAIVSGSPGGEPPDPGNPGGPGTSVYPL